MDIFSSLGSFHIEEPNEHGSHVEFCLNYFGVRKQCVKGNIIYLLVNKDADWVSNAGQKGLHRDGKFLTIDIRELVLAIKSYWQSELLSVGIKVLETLESLHKSKSNNSVFHQSTSLLHIFEVSKFLIDCQCLNLTSSNKNKLQNFLKISTNYFDLVFPLDWRMSMSEDMISLRNTDLSDSLLVDIVLQYIDTKSDLTYWTIGRVMMICLSHRKPLVQYQMVTRGLKWNPAWKSFFEKIYGGLKDADVASELHDVLKDTFKANWRRPGYISPHSFIHLLDSYLFFASFCSGIIFTTKSSLVGWLTQFDSTATPTTSSSVCKQIISDDTFYFIIETIKQILEYKVDTIAWIQRSKISPTSYHPLLALKLVMMLSLICLQVDCCQLLLELLSGRNNIAYLLPKKFVSVLLKGKKDRQLNLSPDVVAEAFISVDDPFVIASSETLSLTNDAMCAIYVDLRKSKEEIMNVLYSKNNTNSGRYCSTNADVKTICAPSSSSSSSAASSSNKKQEANPNVDGSKKGKQQMSWKGFKQISDAINGKKKSATINLNTLAKVDKKVIRNAVSEALSDMEGLSSEINTSGQKMAYSNFMKSMQGAMGSIQSLIPSIEDLFNGSFLKSWEEKVGNLGVLECSSSSNTNQIEEKGDDNDVAEMVLETQNVEDAKNNQEVGSSKKKKSKKGKGKKK